ncbi:thyroid receptor-interacting protein 11 isoform X2 [Manduca sexta]|uniref:thyroid receptor-interacting protein 11 isoform X2 n=1 Tax=Manduca sexta TaxID=7130 RepID=UPI00188E6A2C|nr:thyroid receptor-interacting protein 11 isoform X2 [Manduca sexta]
MISFAVLCLLQIVHLSCTELFAEDFDQRLTRKNGVREDETSWYWDPPSQAPSINQDLENQYKVQIRALQDEISSLKERATIDLRPDAEEELNRLREENQNLTVNLEDLDSQHQQAMERLLSLKKELQKNFEVLKEEHEDLKNTNDEYAVEIKSLLAKVGERDKEIEEFKSKNADYETLYHKYQNLERIHGLLRENAEKFQEENQELHEEVFKLQEQVTKYEHDLEIAVKNSQLSNTVPKEKYDEVLKELNELKDRRNANQVHLDEINIDDNAKSVIENLKRDIHDLKHKLSQKEFDQVQANADHKLIKAEKIMQLYNKYVNFELPIDYVGEIPSPGVNIVLYKLESVFKTVNSFKKDIDNLEHKLSEKNLNLNHLQTQIDDLTTENDFLTTDIQHFESELNEMKKNNDFLISEIAALKNTSKLEPIIETHEDNLAKLETELADCNKLNKDFESEIKRIEKELNEVRKEKTILQDSLGDLKTKYTNMLNEMELFKNQTKAVEELENTANTQYTEKIKKVTDEVDDLKKKLNAANAKNEQLSIDIHIIENDKVLLIKEVDDLKRILEEKVSVYKELENDRIALDHKLKDKERRLEEMTNHTEEIEKVNTALQKQINDLQTALLSNNTNSTDDLEKIIAEKAKLSEQLDSIIKENATLIETKEQLNNIIQNMKVEQEKIITENNALNKNNTKTPEDVAPLQAVIDELKAKIIQQDVLTNEITSLKDENHKLNERKLQLETELSSTDSKIVHLEEEFEKLIVDLNEKDTLIDGLNTTVNQNNVTITNLTQNNSDLEHAVQIKNEEIKRLKVSLEEALKKLNDTQGEFNSTQTEASRLRYELDQILKEIMDLRDQVNIKNDQISNITSKNDELQKSSDNYKIIIDSKDKEIKELNQSIVELTDKLKTTDNTRHHNDEYAKLLEEKITIENQVTELKSNLTVKASELADLQLKYDQIENTVGEYKTAIDNSTAEKTELINLINLKHNESMQYHNEIQRLNHVILEQTNEFKRIIEERERLLHNASENCSACESLKITLKEKDEIIVALNQNASEYERVKTELANASEVVRNMTEKYDNLDKNLAIQLETVKKLTAENAQLSEQEQNSSRELERLRRHLVETEENYTQELMSSEQKLTECQTRLHQVEERAKQTSTVYTSNSIRANQEVETLRNQIKLLERQREEVQARLSEADDARIRSEAALTNLQVVLEQFQLDKERDIHAATEKIRNKMEDQRRQNNKLQEEIARLNAKLEEASAGLQAAARLGDQVETKTAQINDLKDQVRTLQQSVAAAEERYYNAISNQQDKVDKNLVKNLVINYVMTAAQNNINKTQVLRILSTVLDFNKQECEKLGLSKSTPPDSLAAEFVRFLQDESRPRATLPNMMGITRSTTPSSRKSSTVGPHPVFEPGHRRNPSTGSNNLLFQNMDSVDTASQLSRDSDREPRVMSHMETGVNQTRNTEGAILKSVLRDM